MPEDEWEKARQKDAEKQAAREVASGQQSSFERISDDVKPINKTGILNANLRGRKCIHPHELSPVRPDTSPKRRRKKRRLRRQV